MNDLNQNYHIYLKNTLIVKSILLEETETMTMNIFEMFIDILTNSRTQLRIQRSGLLPIQYRL